MTENEAKAIKWMENVRDDAVVTLDHIAKNEPKVSPMFYAGRKEKAETIINGFEVLEQYRAIGTVEECREAREKQKAKKPICNDKMALWDYTCPVCGEPLIQQGYTYNYCDMCGNRIAWVGTGIKLE